MDSDTASQKTKEKSGGGGENGGEVRGKREREERCKKKNEQKKCKKKKKTKQIVTGMMCLDDDLVKESISFCDFDTIIALGMTCNSMHKLSSLVLDELADEIMTKRSEDDVFYHEHLNDDNEAGVQVIVRKSWSSRFESKSALEKAIIDECEGYSNVDIDFDVGRARYLLNTTGQVNWENFLPPEEGRHDQGFQNLLEQGWDFSAKYTTVTRENAASFLAGTVAQSLRGGESDDDSDVMDILEFQALYGLDDGIDDSDNDRQSSDGNSDDGLENVTREDELFRHYILALLRKADSPISRSKLKITHHAPDYGEGGTYKVFNFRLAGSNSTVEILFLRWYGTPSLLS